MSEKKTTLTISIDIFQTNEAPAYGGQRMDFKTQLDFPPMDLMAIAGILKRFDDLAKSIQANA